MRKKTQKSYEVMERKVIGYFLIHYLHREKTDSSFLGQFKTILEFLNNDIVKTTSDITNSFLLKRLSAK